MGYAVTHPQIVSEGPVINNLTHPLPTLSYELSVYANTYSNQQIRADKHRVLQEPQSNQNAE